MEKPKIQLMKEFQPLLTSNSRFFPITGGRWSSKSYSANTLAILLTFEKGQKILHTRFAASTAKDSIIEEIKQKVQEMELEEHFKITDKEATNLVTGGKIIFKGLKGQSNEDLDALKSIAGVTTWIIEEAQQLDNEKLFDTVNRSIRGNVENRKLRTIMLLNPSHVEHWIYKRFYLEANVKAGSNVTVGRTTYIHTSYLDCLAQGIWVDEDFVEDAERTRKTNPERWKNEFMGGWIDIAEGVIFTNWKPNEEFKEFSVPIIGIDWGFRHPTAIVLVSLDPDKMEAYIKCLFYRTDQTFSDVGKWLLDNGYRNTLIVADNARPEGIHELRNAELNVYPTKKNVKGGSVADTIKLVQEYTLMVDPTPLTSQDLKQHPLEYELKSYVWADRVTETPVKKHDDAMDAMRYALARSHTKKPTDVFV